MIKQVLDQIDYSFCAEMALVLFAAIFVAVTIRTLLTKREWTSQYANIALSDLPQKPLEQVRGREKQSTVENKHE